MSILPEKNSQNLKKTVLYIAIGLVLLFLFFKYVFLFLLPFILAYLVALAIDPVVYFLIKKLHLNRHIASALCVICVYSLLITIVYIIINRAIYEIRIIIVQIPAYLNAFPDFIESFSHHFDAFLSSLPIGLTDYLGEALTNFFVKDFSIPPSISNGALTFATNIAAMIPNILLFTIVLIVSTYFISSDRQKIDRFVIALFPSNVKQMLIDTRSHILLTLTRFLRAQFILISITFFELLVGFTIIGVDYALILAFSIALIDALPILGTGSILIPWAIISLITGDYIMALSLALLYAVILFVRQSLEPKIVGESIGLHPIATLMSMYIGLKLFGFIGLFLMPLILIVILFVIKNGYFENKPSDE